MATKQVTRNIALTPRLDRFVETTVRSGRYQSASEVVREGLRLLEEREQHRIGALARLREEIETGWQQSARGEVIDGPSVFAEIRRISKARRKAGGTK
ncbi:MAG TPA: type II toxin-antitoxin system ParD family antitoxin [Humisphaera sp.]|nr:type II toxin-antitoxin system ParD family antitoxin [Humisphaera sp.]